jgi:hypothetical protein
MWWNKLATKKKPESRARKSQLGHYGSQPNVRDPEGR